MEIKTKAKVTRAPPPILPQKFFFPSPRPRHGEKKTSIVGRTRVSTLVPPSWHGKSGATGVESTRSTVNTNGINPSPPSSPSPASGPVCPTLPLPLPHPLPLPVSDFCLRYRVTHRAQSLRIRHQPLSPSPSTPVNQAPGRGAPLPFRSASLV